MSDPQSERANDPSAAPADSQSNQLIHVAAPAPSQFPGQPLDEQSVVALLAADAAQAQAPHPTAAKGNNRREKLTRGHAWSPLAWLRQGTDFLAEKRFARRRSLALLDTHQRITSAAPQLNGKALYARIVIESGYSPKDAQTVLLRTEKSFCEWPTEHELRLQDVVRYLVVTEYLRSNVASPGTHTNMGNVVVRVVPDSL